jgi:hypothetical protein
MASPRLAAISTYLYGDEWLRELIALLRRLLRSGDRRGYPASHAVFRRWNLCPFSRRACR